MNTPRLRIQLATHLSLIAITVAVLYPVLWVLKMALSPGQAFSLDLNPLPSTVTLEHFEAVLSTATVDGRWL